MFLQLRRENKEPSLEFLVQEFEISLSADFEKMSLSELELQAKKFYALVGTNTRRQESL